ncbi:unnamed protein product, partial [marine sediment metagenome]
GVLAAHENLRRLEDYLQEQTQELVVAFVDLAGSTALKRRPQKEWLPSICRFLLHVSGVAEANHGQVVKYIGDEVLAVFVDDGHGLATVHAEGFLWSCETGIESTCHDLAAKYCLDFGRGAWVRPEKGPLDILGTCVDRCARIAKLGKPGTAIASGQYVAKSRNPTSWARIGSFCFHGLAEEVAVHQLDGFGGKGLIDVSEANAMGRDPLEAFREVVEANRQLAECQADLKRFLEEVQ